MSASGRRARDRVAPYGRLAEAYDIVHSKKPYAAEAKRVRALATPIARRPLRTLLDVACGSGRHLEAFSRWYACTGVDASRAMLARARGRVRGARLRHGRMETFDLAETFDIVTCLFSAIAYARSKADLRRVIRNLARHTAPGGVVVVEPFITPQMYRGGRIHTVVRSEGATTVARMNGSRRRGDRVIFDFHHLIGRDGATRHFVESHDCGLFDEPTMLDGFRGAGLVVRHFRRGLSTGRGLYVGLRPVDDAA